MFNTISITKRSAESDPPIKFEFKNEFSFFFLFFNGSKVGDNTKYFHIFSLTIYLLVIFSQLNYFIEQEK